ncbi:MAG: hypothetical protein DLM69_00090 [Candidatus Chloroheliales bacterium]|nr:MAG: hypothetical protein DLM69_00090 [Chloroflexota bacterium]
MGVGAAAGVGIGAGVGTIVGWAIALGGAINDQDLRDFVVWLAGAEALAMRIVGNSGYLAIAAIGNTMVVAAIGPLGATYILNDPYTGPLTVSQVSLFLDQIAVRYNSSVNDRPIIYYYKHVLKLP